MIEGEVSGTGARPIHTIDSAYAKEMRKHEANYTEYGPPGRPYQFRAYPTMMYKADRRDGTGPIVVVAREEAADEVDRARLESMGFVYGGQPAALAAFEKQQVEFATIAAARNYEDRNMGERAKAESAMVEANSTEHVPAIPETPIVRRVQKEGPNVGRP